MLLLVITSPVDSTQSDPSKLLARGCITSTINSRFIWTRATPAIEKQRLPELLSISGAAAQYHTVTLSELQ
jgi:hypothetical protein